MKKWVKRFLTVACAALLIAFLLPAFDGSGKAQAASTGVVSCLIQGNNVAVTNACAAGDDGLVHIYAQYPFQGKAQGREVAQAAPGAAVTVPLGLNTANSVLYSKFQAVVVKGGHLKAVGNPKYITNPEAVAKHTTARHDAGKKGILPSATALGGNQLTDLGIKQITYNLNLGDLTSGGGVNYTYNGKTYSFNSSIVSQYDILVPMMNKKGIQLNMILLNNLGSNPNMIHPWSRDFTGANYYAFNTYDQAGCDLLEAVASFLGERYSGNGHGTIDNWIIGNEVNARQEWNYMNAGVGIDKFSHEYAKAVRIFYNAIRAQNANARVMASVDQEWAVADGPAHYGAKPFLEKFNSFMKAQGNIDWDVATHPYNFPLYDPAAWTMTSKPQVTHTQASRYITMQNVDVFTDFMCQKALLAPNGTVRHIVCSECGYTSVGGNEQKQAASIVFAYVQAMNNKYIDGFILNREQDAAEEIAQGLAYGVTGTDGSHKLSYDWYKTADTAATQAAASAVMGADLSTLITVR
ncbi:MAG: DUF5722 domain-containing protein [Lachnospiraceae bacterium]|nr:DUF5722 domain-containing protein [Lachnospiraceae bacterium]